MGIIPDQCYMTNVIKHRPPRNDASALISLDGKPKISQEFYAYQNALKEELSQLSPNVILAVGGISLFALTGKIGIMKYRGSILESTLLPGRKVIPLIHPAAALREYTLTHLINNDLVRLKEESTFPELNLPEYNIIMKPSFSEAMAHLERLNTVPYVSFDIEVVSKSLECFALAWSPTDAVCFALYDGDGPLFTAEQEAQILQALGRILENPAVSVYTQNGTFDATFMYERYGIFTTSIEDTMVACGLVSPDFPKSLAFITSVYTRQPYYKDDGKQYYKMPTADRTAFWRYNALDTLTVAEAMPALKASLEQFSLTETYNTTVALIPVLILIQSKGIAMDTAGMKAAYNEAQLRIAEMQKELNEKCGQELNVSSPKQVQTYFYITKKIKPHMKNGRPTVDEVALTKIAAKGHDEARMILDIRGERKLCGTYLDMNLDSDGRMRCSYNPIGASTGRLSSSKTIFGTGGNLQNQPPIMRNFMLIDEGYVGYAPDVAGAENKIVANIGPVPLMRQAFDEGKDVHRLTASLLSRYICDRFIPADEVTDKPGQTPIAGGRFSLRHWGKRMNHSANYGIGPNQLADKLEIPPATAKILLEAYHNGYPEVRHGYQAQIIESLRKNRRVFNPFGRSRIFLGRWDNMLFQDAFAFLPQSTVADLINRRGMLLLKDFHDVEILNQVHDAIYFQIPLSCPWSYHAEVLNALNTSMTLPIPWKQSSFVLYCDFVMQKRNMGEKNHVHVPATADALASLYSSIA